MRGSSDPPRRVHDTVFVISDHFPHFGRHAMLTHRIPGKAVGFSIGSPVALRQQAAIPKALVPHVLWLSVCRHPHKTVGR